MISIPLPQLIKILSAVLVVQVIFNLALYFIMPVPLIVIGFGQLVPAALVIIMAPNYRSDLINSLCRIGDIKITVIACLCAAAVILICCAVAFFFNDQVQDLAQLPSEYPFASFLPDLSLGQFFIFLLVLAPFFHLFNATGEEVFWRGYLLSGLTEHFGESKAVFLSGLFWGIWHIPMVVFLNWVFPQVILGSVLFTIAMITWGYTFAYIRIRSKSLWPPILMHATANAFVIGCYDSITVNEFNIYTSPWGILGIMITLPIAILLHRKILIK